MKSPARRAAFAVAALAALGFAAPALAVVTRIATATTVTTTASVAGSTTLHAQIVPASAGGAIGGTVTFVFTLGGGVACMAQAITPGTDPTTGFADCTYASSADGHPVIAQYSGDTSYAPSASGSIVWDGRISDVLVSASANPVALNQPVTLGATLEGGPWGAPTGTVSFTDLFDGTTLCASVALSGGTAQCGASFATDGVHRVKVTYGGDANYLPTASAVLKVAAGSATLPKKRRMFDRNGDGKADIGWQKVDGSESVWYMDGTASITHAAVFYFVPGSLMYSGDFDGDGKSDLLRQSPDGYTIRWTRFSYTAIDVTTSARVAGIGDFNGDGADDVLLEDGGAVQVMLMPKGATTAGTTTQIMPAGNGWHVARIADFNGDGKDDIVWLNDNGAASLWLMDGATVLQRGPLLPAGSPWAPTQVGDFNGDGKADIVWTNRNDGAISMWLMDGLATLQRGPLLAGGSGLSVKLVGDFDGDGRSDLVLQHTDGSSVLWLMNGLALAAQTPLIAAGSGWTPTQAADFDGDGNDDIVWSHPDGAVGLWLMNGVTLVQRGSLLSPNPDWTVARTVVQNP